MRCPLLTTCRVPAALESVTSVGHEVPPHEVLVDRAPLGRIWRAVESLYRSGIHPGIQLCVRHRGRVLLDRAIGHARGNGPADPPDVAKTRMTTRTPVNLFSASKAVTAMVVHLLDERNAIRLDDPVCEYVPEFGVGSKRWITIRHVLIHRSGIPNPPPEVMDLDRLADSEGIVRLLGELPQTWRPGRQLAYHAVTGGFVLGEVVRRVTGRSIRAVLDEDVRRPLGLDWLGYGVRPEEVDQVALNYFTGPPVLPPASMLLRRVLGVGFREVTEMSNDPRFLTGVIPAANVITTANDISRFYQLLLEGGALDGVRVFDPRTVRRATAEQTYFEIDFTLGLPFRYSMGFMLGAERFSFFGPETTSAFGHLGFTNCFTWADPDRQLAVALLTTGKALVYPEIFHLWTVLREIGRACPRERVAPTGPFATVARRAAS